MITAQLRQPLRLKRPPQGSGFRLHWLVEHFSSVRRGEALCEAFGEGEAEPVRLFSPAAGRLFQIVPAMERVPPTAILGELECGPEWEQHLRARANIVRNYIKKRLPALCASGARDAALRRRTAFERSCGLESDIRELEERLDAQGGRALINRTARANRVAAALLAELRQRPADSGPLLPALAQPFAVIVERLRERFGYLLPEPAPAAPAEIRRIRTTARLEILCDAYRADCEERIRGFPPELRQAKLGCWEEIKRDQLRRFFQES